MERVSNLHRLVAALRAISDRLLAEFLGASLAAFKSALAGHHELEAHAVALDALMQGALAPGTLPASI
jgi:hypothetical protein